MVARLVRYGPVRQKKNFSRKRAVPSASALRSYTYSDFTSKRCATLTTYNNYVKTKNADLIVVR